MSGDDAGPNLAQLADATRAADAKAPGAPPGQAQPGPIVADPDAEAKEWAQAPAIFGRIVFRVVPAVKDIYTDEANLEWGRAMVPLAHKYGWTFQKFLAWLGPWVGVAIASEALITPTIFAVQARIAEVKAERAAVATGGNKTPEAKPAA